jgi:hypothetical protein
LQANTATLNPPLRVPGFTANWATRGRHYLTCLNLLMLEVYYRHLPLYIELNIDN